MAFSLKKFVVSGIVGGIAFYIIWLIVNFLLRSALWPYDILSLGGMRSVNDPVMLLFFLYPFVFSFAMAAAYPMVASALKGNFVAKGKAFGFLVWLLAGLPNAFLVFSSMNYPWGFFIEGFVGSFFYLLAAALAIAKFSE